MGQALGFGAAEPFLAFARMDGLDIGVLIPQI